MWESVQVAVGPSTVRGRYRVEGRKLVLEWRGGRVVEWFGVVRPELIAQSRLKQLASSAAYAA